MLSLIAAIIWTILFSGNLFTEEFANRINYGIATFLLCMLFYIEAIEQLTQ